VAEDQGRGRRGAMVIGRLPHDDPESWDASVGRYPDVEVFHCSERLAFLIASQSAEPVVREGERPVGHSVGSIVRRFCARILGSPLRWRTQCMGFQLEQEADRRVAAKTLVPFAFRNLGRLHVGSRYAGLRYGRAAIRRLVTARQIIAGLGRRRAAAGEDAGTLRGSGLADTPSPIADPRAVNQPPRATHSAG